MSVPGDPRHEAQRDAASARTPSARALLGAIAHALLGDSPRGDADDVRIGDLALRPHQRDALRRVRERLASHGGVLLADEVGLGKTLVALALVRDARAPVVVAPAALRPMWTAALARAGLAAPLVSFESLSRGRAVATRPDLLVVDEAHHARSPHTRRYAALAALAAGVRTLLISATPIHNRGDDLAALLALFLGGAAHELSPSELARHVVRHTRADAADDDADAARSALPALEPPRWIALPDEGTVLDALAALPPPVPPADGGDGGALVVHALVRQWASSRGALRGALRRRVAAAGALADALVTGRHPTRAELAAWSHAEGVVQLAFPELVAAEPVERAPSSAALAAVHAHAGAARAILALLARTSDPDAARADALRAVRRAHPGARIVAFTERAETVTALFAQLRMDAGVAALTAAGGRVVGGRCSRAELLVRFAPRAQGRGEPAAAERVDLLLTTDLLSEGVSLHDASVVVHLDLPWTPARLEQRVGRVRRLGSAHARVFVYALRPPADAERLLDVERRLRRKLADAARAVGLVGAVLPPLAGTAPDDASSRDHDASAAECATRVRTSLRRWLDLEPSDSGRPPELLERDGTPLLAVAAARGPGFVALVQVGVESRLIASVDGAPPDDAPAVVERALGWLRDPGEVACAIESCEARRALAGARDEAVGWLRRYSSSRAIGVGAGGVAVALRSRRRVLERIAAIGASAGRHRRAPLAPLLAEARRAASAPLGVGAERVLDALAAAPLDDEPWLRAVGTFGRLHAPGGALARDERPEAARLLAVVLLWEQS